MFLHNLLNVLAQIANKMGFQKKINSVVYFWVVLAVACIIKVIRSAVPRNNSFPRDLLKYIFAFPFNNFLLIFLCFWMLYA
jgi:hypothetical protein